MDLLLTHGYFLYEDAKELQIMKPYAPLGILYLSSHLAERRSSTSKSMIPPSARGKNFSGFWRMAHRRFSGSAAI